MLSFWQCDLYTYSNITINKRKTGEVKNLTVLVQQNEMRYSAQLIIAALNEAPGIGLTIAEMRDTLGEIPVLVVDGRSNDRTVEIAKNLDAKVIYQDGIGKRDALTTTY